MKMTKDHLRQFVTILALALTLVVNGLANALPLNGQTTAEISDRFQVYFVPAGYVFSIWGLIYIGLIAFTIYQALPSQRTNPRLRRVGLLFALSSVANSLWLILWHYEYFVLTLVVMVTLLLLLITIYLRLNIGRDPVSNLEKWVIHRPFQLYLGWITVATIANATSLLAHLQWNGWGIPPEVWTVIMLAAGLLIAAAVGFSRGDLIYIGVLIWAYIGIAVKQAGTSGVAEAAWIAAFLLVLLAVAAGFYGRPPQMQPALSIQERN
jgi:hypothetical protein